MVTQVTVSLGQTNKKNTGYCCWVFRAPVIPPPTYLPSSFKVLQSGKREKEGSSLLLSSVDLIPIPGIQDVKTNKQTTKTITSSSWSKINQYLSKHFIFGLLQVQRIFDSNDVLLKRYLCFGLWHNPFPGLRGNFTQLGLFSILS